MSYRRDRPGRNHVLRGDLYTIYQLAFEERQEKYDSEKRHHTSAAEHFKQQWFSESSVLMEEQVRHSMSSINILLVESFFYCH